ncbi:MAG: DUF971 domain-containing protein [Phycisphaerales bacterium]|nr:DUF971 domain-containing protein [Phycisphaerales bacterium]
MSQTPKHLDLKRDTGLNIEWGDGTSTFYPVDFLRKMSPSADTKQLLEELKDNPLAVLPIYGNGPLTIEDIELVGNYAVRFVFSDGHSAGIYSWEYLFNLKPQQDV